MKKLILLLPFLLAFSKPSSETVEYLRQKNWQSLRSQVLARAKSEKALDRDLKQLEELFRDFEVCGYQLKLRTLPLKCFDVIAHEIKLGVTPRDRTKFSLEVLDKLCEEQSSEIVALNDLRFQGVKKQNLSPKCRTALHKRRELLKYKALESDPKALFDLRLETHRL